MSGCPRAAGCVGLQGLLTERGLSSAVGWSAVLCSCGSLHGRKGCAAPLPGPYCLLADPAWVLITSKGLHWWQFAAAGCCCAACSWQRLPCLVRILHVLPWQQLPGWGCNLDALGCCRACCWLRGQVRQCVWAWLKAGSHCWGWCMGCHACAGWQQLHACCGAACSCIRLRCACCRTGSCVRHGWCSWRRLRATWSVCVWAHCGCINELLDVAAGQSDKLTRHELRT